MPRKSRRSHDRLLQGVGAVYSVGRAAELLPWSDAKSREWLQRSGLVRVVEGKAIVVWCDVLNLLRRDEGDEPEPPEEPNFSLPRVRLKPL
jgi:hypothetical protein